MNSSGLFHSTSGNSSITSLNQRPQTEATSCPSSSTDTYLRNYSNDSHAQDKRKDEDQSWTLTKDNHSLLNSESQNKFDQTLEHECNLHPSQQCPSQTELQDLQTNSISFLANNTYQKEFLGNKPEQIYKTCSYCHSHNYPRQTQDCVPSPQSFSSWGEAQYNLCTNTLQNPTYGQDEAGCSFKVIVMPPQKHDKSTFCCKECGQHFTKESNLKKHVERLSQHLEEPYFKCKYCSHIFKTKEARKRHHPVHKMCLTDNFARVRCSVCGFKFSSKEKLQHHLHRFTENSDERIFKCFFCSHAFTTDFGRNRHEGQMHTEAHRLPCCCCGKLFTNRYKLKLHRIKQQIQRPPRCQDCGWVFAAQEYLEDHQRHVQRNLPHECLVCHHRYQSQLALLRHLKFHTKKMEYECPACLGRFSSENLLTKHLRTAPRRANTELYQGDSGLQEPNPSYTR